ncbi:MAG: LysR substrate-binding domain-containing protein, partial [Rhizobacter sp.]
IAANNAILDIDRERIELAVRYCPSASAPAGAVRLFGEEVFPVCAPGLRGLNGQPLKVPEDLRHHVLLEQEHAETERPSGSWTMWLEAMGLHRFKPAGSLRFSHYDQLIQAAIDGQGVALGISPLVRRHMSLNRLVAPFEHRIATPRAYHLIVARHAAGRADVAAFVDWLMRNASQEDEAALRLGRR